MTDWKPEGYRALSPYFVLADPDATIDFAVACLDAEPLRMVRDDQGRLRHGEIRVGGVVVMMGGAVAGWPAQQGYLHLYVEDVDAVHARALSLGAEQVQAPDKRGDPDRRGGFRDPGGLVWWVATQIDPE